MLFCSYFSYFCEPYIWLWFLQKYDVLDVKTQGFYAKSVVEWLSSIACLIKLDFKKILWCFDRLFTSSSTNFSVILEKYSVPSSLFFMIFKSSNFIKLLSVMKIFGIIYIYIYSAKLPKIYIYIFGLFIFFTFISNSRSLVMSKT